MRGKTPREQLPTEQSIQFAIPSGKPGSGLSIIVGSNNSGKSTIIEALRAFVFNGDMSFGEGRRSKLSDERVTLRLTEFPDREIVIETIARGGSETTRSPGDGRLGSNLVVLPSRRYFSTYFSRTEIPRNSYAAHLADPQGIRGGPTISFPSRLFNVQKQRAEFDALFKRVLDPVPQWFIEQSDAGMYYIKVESAGQWHSSDGAGEGILSLLFLIDALYDSQPGDAIVVDEPELSLHPAVQRKLAALLFEYSKDRQIIVATHSPYFLPFEALQFGAKIARVFKTSSGAKIAQLSEMVANRLSGILQDRNNPHVLGLDAREIFFLEDHVILVEGQDDVIYYRLIANQLQQHFRGEFFGWGVGGATKMPLITQVLQSLGFQHVVGILDGDKSTVAEELRAEFPSYSFYVIPAADVRTKKTTPSKPAVLGLLDENAEIRPEHIDDCSALIAFVNDSLV